MTVVYQRYIPLINIEKEVNIPEQTRNYGIGILSNSMIEAFLNEWKKIKDESVVRDPRILYGTLLFLSFLSSKATISSIEYGEKQDQIEIRLKGCCKDFLKEKEEIYEEIVEMIGDRNHASLIKYAVGVVCEDLPKLEIPIDKFLKEYGKIKDPVSKDEVVKKIAMEILKVIHENGYIVDVAYIKDDDSVYVFLRNCSLREWDRIEGEILKKLEELEKDYGEKVWDADTLIIAWCLDETI
ncbi:hypothetical protein [Acidianus sp. RZ1]|uniref:hypothetical protein n=1 Tax=Acidianus sp. RZ1 TaxID=1540082 RepID=UPI00149173F4|nr:hypothetical protein [Acidianus sp. RZ1]NON61764.1 hypothetical protein [Acidianus sp. RZ1]